MSFQPGDKLSHYEILEPIGKGGMGEVFRARDGKLGRDVAIKVLPDEFAQDRERLKRFQREAKVLASLNHPNIASIYGLEQSESTHYLVLELVPGETLAERIARGPIPVDEAVDIATKIAEALEAAHERGIVHRDLKPANIMLTPDDKVKVLDYGLAKALSEETPAADSSMSPTLTRDATRVGVILGTAAYMSPEQAKGKPVDKRADIWAFGCVLYEALTGRQAFVGDSVTDILTAVVRAEPDWSALPSGTPAAVVQLLKRCLRKAHAKRLRDAGDVAIALEEALDEPMSETPPPRLPTRALPWVVAAVTAGVAIWSLARTPAPLAPSMQLSLPMNVSLAWDGVGSSSIAISPGGDRLVYVATRDDRRQIFLRALDEIEGEPIAGTEDGQGPFFSPDGQRLGFFADGKLKKVSVSGGRAVTLCDAPIPSGGTWGPDDTIVFAPLDSGGLSQISADGGAPTVFTTLDEGERSHYHPRFLPGGRAVLFVIETMQEGRLVVQETATGARHLLVAGGPTDPRYLASGHVAYTESDSLMVAPFDPERLKLNGPPVPVVEDLATTGSSRHFDFSSLGWLAYSASAGASRERRLLWVNRDGDEEALTAPTRLYAGVRLSPDGRQIRVGISGDRDVWVLDNDRNALTRVTFEEESRSGVWSPDGEYLAVNSVRGGYRNVYRIRADGTGEPEQLTATELPSNVNSWSPDGQVLVFTERHPDTGRDLMLVEADGGRAPDFFLQTRFNEGAAKFSPDGQWLAYVSDETGRAEIYVRPYPGPGRKWQISSEGGTEPVWSRDGRELFYRDGYTMMSVDIGQGAELTPGRPKLLFRRPYRKALWSPNYDIANDGRFIMIEEGGGDTTSPEIRIVTNWAAALEF